MTGPLRFPATPTSALLTALFLPMLLLSGCGSEQADAPAAITDTPRPARIVEVSSGADALLRRFPGKVAAAEEVQLAFRVPGELQTLPALAGQQVAKGAVLATLDPSDYQLAVNERQARYQLASSQFDRIDNLYQKNQVSRAQYDQSKAELDIAKAAYDSATTDLSYTTLKAPFAGIVADKYTDNHQSVAAGTPILKLQARGQLVVVIQVPEQLMIQLSRSDNQYHPEVEFDALPGQRFDAAYKQHNTEADPATGSYQIQLQLPRPEGLNPLPGMSASVYADLSKVLSVSSKALVIPVEAVFQSAQQQEGSQQASVWLVNSSNQLELREIVTGKITQAGIEVVSGLEAGDRILAAGVNTAQAGMSVRPWQQERGL